MSASRLLVIARDFPPCAEMGAQSTAQIVRHLSKHGWEPIVLTANESEFDETMADAVPFDGRVVRVRSLPHPLEVYRRFRLGSLRRKVIRTPSQTRASPYGAPSAGWRRFVLSLLLVPDPHLGWAIPAILRARSLVARGTIRHVFSSGPCWTNHLVGLAIASSTKLPWTAHFRDPWMGAQPQKPTSKVSSAIEQRLESSVIRRADAVVSVTERHSAWLRSTHPGVPSTKFHTVPNGFDEEEWVGITDDDDHTEFRIIYTGRIYGDRAITPLFRALASSTPSGVPRDRVHIVLVGWWTADDRAMLLSTAKRFGLEERVSVAGPWDRRETLRAIMRSHLALVLAEGWDLQIPGKTYEYLRAGRPILALAPPDGSLADLLRATSGGVAVDPTDESGIASVIDDFYGRWRLGEPLPRANPEMVQQFGRSYLAGRLATILDQVSLPQA